jgi:hypothetical protein
MTPRLKTALAATAAAGLIGAGLIGLGTAAQAQPMHRGPHGGGDVIMAIARLQSQLDLNTSQQTMWDNAVATGKSARASAQANQQNVANVLNAELAKPEPDLAAVAAAADAAQAQNTALRHQARAAWLGLYATFSTRQKAVVKTAIQQRLARSAQWRTKMQQHLQPSPPQG